MKTRFWRWRSLRFRLAATAAAGVIVGLLIVGFFLSVVFRQTVEASFDDRLSVILKSLLTYAEVDPNAGMLVLRYVGDETRFEQSYQGWYWQVSPALAPPTIGGPLVLRSKSLEDWSLAVDKPVEDGVRLSGTVYGPLGQKLRYVSASYKLPGSEESFLFAVAGNYDEVDNRIADFRVSLIQSIGIMVLALGGVLLAQIAIATSPMRRIRDALASVRDGQAEQLEGQFLSEVEPLIDELNGLLEHNAQVVDRARTQVGNLAHALKTPLAVLQNEVHGAEGSLARVVDRETTSMQTQVEHYLKRARAAASVNVLGVRAAVAPRLEALVRAMRKIHADQNLVFEMSCADDLMFRGDSQDFDEMLGNLIDNASRFAKSTVRVTAQKSGEMSLSVVVEDDGPGLAAAERETVLARGARLDETKPGSGLGLSIVKDIAELYEGDLTLEASELGGLKAALKLPAL